MTALQRQREIEDTDWMYMAMTVALHRLSVNMTQIRDRAAARLRIVGLQISRVASTLIDHMCLKSPAGSRLPH